MPNDTDQNTSMMLGELRGQIRELIHGDKQRAQESIHIVKTLAKLEDVPADVREIKVRLAALEAKENQRVGVMSLGTWLMRSNLAVYIVMVAGAAYAWAKGLLPGGA